MRWQQKYKNMTADVIEFLEKLEKKGFTLQFKKFEKKNVSGYVITTYCTWIAIRDGISLRGSCEDKVPLNPDLYYMVETGGYKKFPRGKWTGKGWQNTTWKEKQEFIDNYKIPVQIREITNHMEFVASEILTDTWSKWNDCLYWVKVEKLVAIQGTTISPEYINIPQNDVWYLCNGGGRYGTIKFAVNPEVTIWIPVHTYMYGTDKEKLRQTRTQKGKLTVNDQKLIAEAIKQYNSKKLT